MNTISENTYWIAIAHLPRWTTERINRLIIKIIHESKISWAAFFDLDKSDWKSFFAFTQKELSDLEYAKNDMPRLAFLTEQLQNEGFQIIPITSDDYPAVLKENLKIKSSPPILYTKGNIHLLRDNAVAIVGSRKAGNKAIEFTDYVAKKSVKENKVVVSGFAKGVDKQALDSAIEASGRSIIVLPQGIMTFQTGFRKYYKHIVSGDLLVLSTFFPKAPWSVGLAMSRNAYIYGLANEIYVAESDSKGGTWEGVLDGLKRGRNIFVRYPEKSEKNANLKLLEMGAIAVDYVGKLMSSIQNYQRDLFEISEVSEPINVLENNIDCIEKEILRFLNNGVYTSKEIVEELSLDWDTRKMTSFLKKNHNVKFIIGSKPSKFTISDIKLPTLF